MKDSSSRVLTENCLIVLRSTIEQDGETDHMELMTRGSFVHRNDSFFISYNETITSGYEGCSTTVKIDGERKVSMMRYGTAPSQLVIECGRRHVCHYETGHGALSLGVCADEIRSDLSINGGTVRFSYLLDVNAAHISRNIVEITVTLV